MSMFWALPMIIGCAWVNTPSPGTPGTDTDTDLASDTEVSGECPSGMVATPQATLVITNLLLGGQLLATTFDPGASFDGQAAACVSDDGTQARWLFATYDELGGSLQISTSDVGDFDLTSDPEVSLSLTIYDADSDDTYSFHSGSWFSGSMSVFETPDKLDIVTRDAQGLDADSTAVSMTATASATVP